MVVLVRIDAPYGVLFVEWCTRGIDLRRVQLLELIQNTFFVRNLTVADYNALVVADWLMRLEPRMCSYLCDLDSFRWILSQNLADEVHCVRLQKARHLEFSLQNLLVQLRCVWVLERQPAAEDRIHYDAAAPYVDHVSGILEACYHFWSCIAWTTASCLEQFVL